MASRFRRQPSYRRRALPAVAVALLFTGPIGAAPPDDSRKSQVALFSSVSAVAPGADFDVALSYKLADEWHIYWKNPGLSGQPPRVEWQLPPGFTAGELRFPGPWRHEGGTPDFKIVTYVLDGEPVLLAKISAPPDVEAGTTVKLAGQVTSLVCKDKCLSERQAVALELPVVSDASAVQPANAELFERAAKAIPPADGRGKFVTLSASPAVDSVAIGDRFEVAVKIDIRKGFHIQSHRPYIKGLIATEVVPEPVAGAEFGDPEYPKPKERIDRQLKMKLSEFVGAAEVRLPVEVTDEATGDSLELGGIVIAQACDERSGRCFAPETVAWQASVRLVGAPSAGKVTAPPDTHAATAGAEPAPATDTARPDQPTESTDAVGSGLDGEATGAGEKLSLPMILLFAFLGGIILNVMPCVWPVISIKILSFVQQAHDDPKRVLRLGLLFGLGILVSFWLLGAVAVAAKIAATDAGGAGPTWGTQFASSTFVVVLTVVIYVFGLSLFGVFEINLPGGAVGKLGAAAEKEGYAGSFLKGMMATVLATPCTAPLLGPAIAVAFTQSGVVIMLAMTAIGIGMGLPYVLLAAKPAWLKFLPKPGPWMDTFKQFTGFLLMGVVIWMLWVLGSLTGASGVVATLAFLTILGLACWLYGRIKLTWSAGTRMLTAVAAVMIAAAGGWWTYTGLYTPPDEILVAGAGTDALPALPVAADWENRTPWVPHRSGLQRELAQQGHTVFVNYTAVWCTKCLIQKKTIIETDEIRGRMRELGVVPLKADYTRRPDWITREIKGYGRAGIPLSVVVPAGRPDDAIILTESMSKDDLLEALEQAGSSSTGSTSIAQAP